MIFVDFPTVRQKYDHKTDDDLVSSYGDRSLEEFLYPYEYEIRFLSAFISRMRKIRSNLHDRGLSDETIVSMSKNSWASAEIQNLAIFIQDEPRRKLKEAEILIQREKEYNERQVKISIEREEAKKRFEKQKEIEEKNRRREEKEQIAFNIIRPLIPWMIGFCFLILIGIFTTSSVTTHDKMSITKIDHRDLMVERDLYLRKDVIQNTRNEWERNRLIREYQDIYNRYHNTNITFDSQFDFLPD